ncbi:MAG: hypothetical protein JWR67_3768 [Mucilaginibacter sp.]|nr:hypothetical protein [Mucilaginibacter sp.]
MDVSFYISELLEQYGKIGVPGLGFLEQARVPGYYNEAEAKFYPPSYRILFDSKPIDDDDILVQYIADKKNISLTSSKFFTEKYITDIKENALLKEVALSNLGWFFTEKGELKFKATYNNPAFFGFPPVKIKKIENAPVSEPVIEQSFAGEVSDPELAEQAVAENDIYGNAEVTRSYAWLIILLVVLVAALAVFGIYQYAPSTFNQVIAWEQKITGTKPPVVKQKAEPRKVIITPIVPPKHDTVDTNSNKIKTDTTKPITSAAGVPAKPNLPVNAPAVQTPTNGPAKQTPANITTSEPSNVNPNAHWEVIALSCKTHVEAERVINYFNKEGLHAYISNDTRGSLIRIAVGAYNTNDEADSARIKLTKSKKIPKDAYLKEIKRKK